MALLISTNLRKRLKVLWPHHTRIKVKRSREIDYSLGQSIVFSYFKPLLTSISMTPLALNSYFRVSLVRRFWRFPFKPKYRNIRSEIKWNEPVRFGRAKYLRPPLKVVYIDRSGHFCPLDCRNVPLHLTKLLRPLPLMYKYNNKKRNGLGRVRATRMYSSTGQMKFQRIQAAIFVERKHT